MRRAAVWLGVLLCFASSGAVAAGLETVAPLRWGMSVAAARDALPAAQRLAEPWEFGPYTAPLMIPRATVGGVRFRVFLQFDAGQRLRQVLFENRRGVRSKIVIRAVLRALDRHYGAPAWSCGGGDPDAKRVTLVWPGPATTVQATFLDFLTTGVLMRDPSRDIDPLRTWREQEILNWRFLPRRLLIRLHAAGDPDLTPKTGGCRRLAR